MADSPILQRYLHAKNNKSYLKLMTFLEFTKAMEEIYVSYDHSLNVISFKWAANVFEDDICLAYCYIISYVWVQFIDPP